MNRRVVVTGMGIVSPIGNNVADFRSALFAGKRGFGHVSRFDTTDYKASVVAEVKDFNARDYMEKAEMLRSDPVAHFAIAAASQAVEQSGFLGTLSPERIGVYFGTGIGGITTFGVEQDKLRAKGARRVSPYFIPMMIANMAAGMIAIRFNCQGAALPAVTACASGSNAIGEAVRAIRHGYCDAVITGGAEAPITEISLAGFINMQALSTAQNPEEACLPFDARRGGFVMGEGGAALVLEEYEHAKTRGATILGEVCGYGSTCDAHHITAPHPEGTGAVAAMRQALQEAGYDENTRLYINAHGTGTPLNDAMETRAIKTLLGEKAYQTPVSSSKSMTGHMLGAAGAAEAIACLLALQENKLPPTVGLEQPDEACDLDYVPHTARVAEIDLALSNSLGFGGHNACLAFRKV